MTTLKALTPNLEFLNKIASILPVPVIESFNNDTLKFAEYVVGLLHNEMNMEFTTAWDKVYFEGSYAMYLNEIEAELETWI